MSHDGLPVRAGTGAREAGADRRAFSGRIATPRHVLVAAMATSPSSSGRVRLDRELRVASPARPARRTSGPLDRAVGRGLGCPVRTGQPDVSFKEANGSKIFGGGILTDLGEAPRP